MNSNTPYQFIENKKSNPLTTHDILQGINTEKVSEIRQQAEDQVNKELKAMIEECMGKMQIRAIGLKSIKH